MKNKSDYIKRVYKRVAFKGGFWFDQDHSLGRDFPALAHLLSEYGWIKCEFKDHTRDGVCYIDKYGNVIVRFRINIYNQTKLNLFI